MKLIKIALLVFMAAFIMLSPLVLAACDTGSGEDNTPAAYGLDGKWEMTRTSITPELPEGTGLVQGFFLSSRSTWEITGALEGPAKAKILYDGRERWFKIPSIGLTGLDIAEEPRGALGTQITDVSMTVTTAGRITVSRFSFIGLPEFTNVVINYRDSVSVSYKPVDKVEATIKVNMTSGNYKVDGETRPITPYTAVITYTGVRKK